MLEIQNLEFKYEGADVNAVDGVTLSVEKGEFVAVLGHNGSGKSTMAKCINGLYTPTAGDVIVDGMNTKDEEEIWNIRARAGMVFQNPDNQIVATVVEEDVAFGAENLGIEREEMRRRVDYALKAVEMYDRRFDQPHQLSGGQKQRVAIAGILAMNPDYIVLDEPTAMLDPVGRREVMDTILRLNREQNKTVLLITHFMDEAVLADRVVVMEKGRVLLEGAPHTVFDEVETMKRIGLDVPQVTELAYRLKQRGIPLPAGILTREEFVEALCRVSASEM
ncbi:Energy-coupling factor transporter ATP-binding protein EcfA1 [Aedoeadaptatus ivorii]|uniref:Energy-coupling factor transporter ATP-binding protein EcfA1 n=1 Tax=Aedoeadaptatus ivorii TaxID=54006 RepID=A0A3S4ZRE5_9FIRM|nr:energy-coupling factor transporter ATPase [Peptoniphilus ivorii]MDQ0508709.1 energy-coupling factor transport system ATP-binding protein [Peptoniphilus ivorii]VEJ36164.1 Energy-coupling factor transporter ATP-binding protein EcfA1 [Peptoniphilus ivorii]